MKKRVGRKAKKPNKELFETLYYNDNVTAAQLAKEYGVTENTIYTWAYKFRKETKNHGMDL